MDSLDGPTHPLGEPPRLGNTSSSRAAGSVAVWLRRGSDKADRWLARTRAKPVGRLRLETACIRGAASSVSPF